jgi:putative phosphoesterase
MLIGLISDTHGLIRPEVKKVFQGVDLIFHGGDVGNVQVLNALKGIAPVVSVRGNCDRDDWSRDIPAIRSVETGNQRFLLIHNLRSLKKLPRPVNAVIFGHSHQAAVYRNGEILYVNPGSAGPKRFRLPVTVGRIRIEDDELIPEIVMLV